MITRTNIPLQLLGTNENFKPYFGDLCKRKQIAYNYVINSKIIFCTAIVFHNVLLITTSKQLTPY